MDLPALTKRAHVRAALIALVLLVEGVEALPHSPLNEDRLARPEGQRLITWLERGLSSIGAHPGRERIGSRLIAASSAQVALRDAVLAPFEPLFRLTATGQQWTLFITVGRECFRLHIDAAGADGQFHPVYRALGLDSDDLAPLLEYRRLRGIYDPKRTRPPSDAYAGAANFIAQRLFTRHPDWRSVRVRQERLYIGEPGSQPRSLGSEHELPLIERTSQP